MEDARSPQEAAGAFLRANAMKVFTWVSIFFLKHLVWLDQTMMVPRYGCSSTTHSETIITLVARGVPAAECLIDGSDVGQGAEAKDSGGD
jgi:hypothetical protein